MGLEETVGVGSLFHHVGPGEGTWAVGLASLPAEPSLPQIPDSLILFVSQSSFIFLSIGSLLDF